MSNAVDKAASLAARVELANRLYREFYTSCFWHMKPDLVVTAALIPIIVRGLRTHGGRPGMLAADKLVN
jgi:hypothetical protein